MLSFAVLCFAALAVDARSISESPPEWGSQYSVSGVFYLPLSDLQEPFAAWLNDDNKYSVEYKASGASVYVLPPSDSLPKGSLRKVHPYFEDESVKWRCIKKDLDIIQKQPLIERVLPDMADYEFIGTEYLLGIEATKWQKVFTNNDSRTEYSVWVKTADEESIPLKYEVNVYSTLLGTHENHFYLEYNEYSTEVDSSVFDKTNDMTCEVIENDYYIVDNWNPMDDNLLQVRTETDEHHFEKFKLIHGRRYASHSEHEERLAIFKDNLRLINEHNRGDSTYKMAVNHLADRTEEELAALFGSVETTSDVIEKGLPFPYSSEEIQKLSLEIPKEIDWRALGAVTPVKQQLDCGSCWAFSAVGAVEGAVFLHNNRSQHVERLSEQALVDCFWSNDTGGCLRGGDAIKAFEFVKNYGLPSYEAYGGYLGENGMCHIENVTKTESISDWVNVNPRDETALKVAIAKHGPVAVSFYVKSDTFSLYSSGVYYDPECVNNSTNHAVLAVGYGVLEDQSYWLIKNSWGTEWGDDGYFLIATKDNNCGMMNEPAYVVV